MDSSGTKHRKDVLEALGRYQNRGAILTDNDAIGEMLANESDRGVVIILGSFIEDALLDRILEAFPPMSAARRKNLVRSGGPLNSFSARVNLGLALGVLTDEDAAMLDVIKAMRNACAHSRHDISFTTPELRSALLLLFGGESLEVLQNTTNEVMLNSAFIFVSSYLLGILVGETKEESEDRVSRMVAEMTQRAREEAAKLASSPQTPTEPPSLSGPSFPKH